MHFSVIRSLDPNCYTMVTYYHYRIRRSQHRCLKADASFYCYPSLMTFSAPVCHHTLNYSDPCTACESWISEKMAHLALF